MGRPSLSPGRLCALGLAIAALLPATGALAQQQRPGAPPPSIGGGGGACSQPTLPCATSATPFVATDGTLWLAYAAGGVVLVTRSADKGAHFAPAVPVTPRAVRLDDGPDARPAIVVDKTGHILVSYAVFRDADWNGEVFLSHSDDGGQHFSPPTPIAPDSPSQRFQTMALDASDSVFMAWLDKRDAAAAHAAGTPYAGAALAFTWIDPAAGQSEAPSRIAVDNTCECCRLGVGFAGPGRPVVAFRNVFPGSIRDHALVAFADRATPGPLHRVSEDGWKLDGCPHQGPSLAVDGAGGIHVAWFSGGGVRRGVFYARSLDGGTTFSPPLPIGAPDRQVSRPNLLATPAALYLVWKEFDGDRTELRLMRSQDQGATWSAPAVISATEASTDHPLLFTDGHDVFVSWLVRGEGLRLVRVGGMS